MLQFFVQTSDQLKPPTTRYSSKNRSVVFNACWDEYNSVKFVRSLAVNSFRNQEPQVLHWHWQRRQCPSQAMKGSRSRYTLPTNLSTFFPCSGELCHDAYPSTDSMLNERGQCVGKCGCAICIYLATAIVYQIRYRVNNAISANLNIVQNCRTHTVYSAKWSVLKLLFPDC